MSIDNGSKLDIEKLINLIEANLGSWKARTILILDVNFKIWGKKGEVSTEVLNFYRKFPFREMHVGDTVHNQNTFMMKIAEKIAVIIEMRDPHISRLSAINLRGRINALSEFSILGEHIKDTEEIEYKKIDEAKEKLKKMEKLLNRIDEMLKDANKVFGE
ncbi:MAG: hypothetical protein QXO71_09730 [Candidatus Jordarchaeaceae archaeon]